MLTGGRVLNHLKRFVPDTRNTLLLGGFQAPGTRGAQIAAGAAEVKVQGEWVPIRCRVEQLASLSAHADYGEILEWLGTVPAAPERAFIVHGEPQAADALRVRIEDRFGWNVTIPRHRESFELS